MYEQKKLLLAEPMKCTQFGKCHEALLLFPNQKVGEHKGGHFFLPLSLSLTMDDDTIEYFFDNIESFYAGTCSPLFYNYLKA